MCSRTLQNFSFHPWLLENIGAQTIHQGYWSLHVLICLCRPLHNLHLLLKDEHCWSRKTTRWPIPRTNVCDIERNEKDASKPLSHCLCNRDIHRPCPISVTVTATIVVAVSVTDFHYGCFSLCLFHCYHHCHWTRISGNMTQVLGDMTSGEMTLGQLDWLPLALSVVFCCCCCCCCFVCFFFTLSISLIVNVSVTIFGTVLVTVTAIVIVSVTVLIVVSVTTT